MNLSKRAMLVSVTISLKGLLGERRDRAASDLVTTTYSAKAKRAKASKYLIDRDHPKPRAIIAAAQQVRTTADRYTFPWVGGLRLLPVTAHAQFTTKVDEALADLSAVEAEYLHIYPYLVSSSERDLGGLFKQSEYPPVEAVAKMFEHRYEFWPLPESGHFVADIAAEAAKEARDAITKATIERTNEAVNDLVGRVEKTVQVYVDKLAAYKPKATDETDGRVKGVFRDSLVENVAEMARLVRALNFTSDPGINSLATQVERLARHAAIALRDDKEMRSSAISEGQALIHKLDSYRKVDSEVDDLIASVSDYQLG